MGRLAVSLHPYPCRQFQRQLPAISYRRGTFPPHPTHDNFSMTFAGFQSVNRCLQSHERQTHNGSFTMPRTSPASVPARQTMDKAFRDLEQTIAPQDSRQFHCTTLDDVRKAARDIERELAARRSLRNMRRLTPLFQGMEHYSKSMDILCNGTPFLPWVWSPITLILRIASEYVEAFEQIIKGYSRIAESLKRFEILSQAFASEPGFQETMAAIYDDILQFHKHAYRFVSRNGI